MLRLAFAAILLLDVFVGVSSAEVTFNWATIGNPGNISDSGIGSVDHVFRMGLLEVTNGQYRDFLNRVDPFGDNANALYNEYMGSDPRGGIGFDPDAAAGLRYSLKPEMANKPVNYVSYYDAMRFVNWLENDQPSGTGTENGVYALGPEPNGTRAPGSRFFIPSYDEWHKAAYHDPRSAADGGPPTDNEYWLYPTKSNDQPEEAAANSNGQIANPGFDVANYNYGADWAGQDGNVTSVGSASAFSRSYYGTYDQAGNVREWAEVEGPLDSLTQAGSRGGSWANESFYMMSTVQSFSVIPFEESNRGFRIASRSLPDVACDFDGVDGCNLDDIDMLIREILVGTNRAQFDLTGDNLVNISDRDSWLAAAGEINLPGGAPYLIGDLNLDGTVDGLDFVIWNANKYTSVDGWSEGDVNGDGTADGLDFLEWNENRFNSGKTLAVPEPGLSVLSLVILSLLFARLVAPKP